MDPQLKALSDQQDILRTVNWLFIETDNRNWPVVRQCLAEEVLFDMSSAGGGEPARLSPQQITDAWEAGLKDVQALHHQTGNYIVDVEGEEADVFCYGTATHYLPHASGRNTRTFTGSYNFHLVQRGGHWVIDQFRFNLKFLDGNLQLTAQ